MSELRDLGDLPLPLARAGLALLESNDDHLFRVLAFVESVVRWTVALGIARTATTHRDWAAVAPKLIASLTQPSLGKRLHAIDLMERLGGPTGWPRSQPLAEAREFVALVAPTETTTPTVRGFLGHVSQVRNDFAHLRVGDTRKAGRMGAALGRALLAWVRTNPLFTFDVALPRAVDAPIDEPSWQVSMSARGPWLAPVANGRRQPVPSGVDVRTGCAYLVEGGRWTALHPFVVVREGVPCALDAISPRGATYADSLDPPLEDGLDRWFGRWRENVADAEHADRVVNSDRDATVEFTSVPGSTPDPWRPGRSLGGYVVREVLDADYGPCRCARDRPATVKRVTWS